jgi:hypothetical protein
MEFLTGGMLNVIYLVEDAIRKEGGAALDNYDEWARNHISLRVLAARTNFKYALVVLMDIAYSFVGGKPRIHSIADILRTLLDVYKSYGKTNSPMPEEQIMMILGELQHAAAWFIKHKNSATIEDLVEFQEAMFVRAVQQEDAVNKRRDCTNLRLEVLKAQCTRRVCM